MPRIYSILTVLTITTSQWVTLTQPANQSDPTPEPVDDPQIQAELLLDIKEGQQQ